MMVESIGIFPLFALFTLAKKVCTDDISGNFVECGVAAGGSTALLAYVIKRYSKRQRTLFACDERYGNCTDFHSLFIGEARSLGIPSRFHMGIPFPMDSNEGEIGGYHCWAEFWIDGYGWIPIDAQSVKRN